MAELLAPAGSFDGLRGAVNAGCDAVYIGGTRFGARAFADNPDTELMKRCLDFCHLRGRKLYMTVNTLFKENELERELCTFLAPYYEHGLDAVIVQDTGAMDMIAGYFPDLDIHLSTQASIMTAEGAERLRSRWPSVTRVVPARELSLGELKEFRERTGLEMEVFVHGALCYCYSGQCLMSSLIGGRSGNRGRCAQPCRRLYDGKYLLSPKDMCTIGHIPELMEAGIDSFKIEGRMKSPEYTAGVVEAYRRAIDAYMSGEPFDADSAGQDLRELYNRGGFSEGYLFRHNSPDMMSFERPSHSGVPVGTVVNVHSREALIGLTDDIGQGDVLEIRDMSGKTIYEFTAGKAAVKGEIISVLTMKDKRAGKGYTVHRTKNSGLLSRIRRDHLDSDSTVPVGADCTCITGQPVTVVYKTLQGQSYTASGPVVQKASNRPVDRESLMKQLSKTGGTPFTVNGGVIKASDDAFVPVGELNSLRREAVAGLEKQILDGFSRNRPESADKQASVDRSGDAGHIGPLSESILLRTVSVLDPDQLKAAIESGIPDRIIYNITDTSDEEALKVLSETEKAGIPMYFGLPYVCRYEIFDRIKAFMTEYRERAAFLVRDQEEYAIGVSLGCRMMLDRSLYIMNRRSLLAYDGEPYTIPSELNAQEIPSVASADAEMIVYGYQPVMISAQCVYRNMTGKCLKEKSLGASTGDGLRFTSFVDEMGHTFRALQRCAFCQNTIYNQSCLDITSRIDELRSAGVGSIRYEFTFERPEEVLKVLTEGISPDGHVFTNGHFTRGVE